MVEKLNESFGVQNISQGNYSGVGLQEFASKTGNLYASNAGGSVELASVFFLILMGTGIYKAGADPDMAVASLAPAVFFMSMNGLLPSPQGWGVAAILATGVLFIAGLVRFLR